MVRDQSNKLLQGFFSAVVLVQMHLSFYIASKTVRKKLSSLNAI